MNEIQPELERQPQAINLTADQSQQLREASGNEPGTVFMVTAPATWPEDPATWKLWCVPAPAKQVNTAIKRMRKASR